MQVHFKDCDDDGDDDDDDDDESEDDDGDDDASKQTAGNWRFESSGRDTQPALPSVPNSSEHFFFIFLSYSLLNCTFSFSTVIFLLLQFYQCISQRSVSYWSDFYLYLSQRYLSQICRCVILHKILIHAHLSRENFCCKFSHF